MRWSTLEWWLLVPPLHNTWWQHLSTLAVKAVSDLVKVTTMGDLDYFGHFWDEILIFLLLDLVGYFFAFQLKGEPEIKQTFIVFVLRSSGFSSVPEHHRNPSP